MAVHGLHPWGRDCNYPLGARPAKTNPPKTACTRKVNTAAATLSPHNRKPHTCVMPDSRVSVRSLARKVVPDSCASAARASQLYILPLGAYGQAYMSHMSIFGSLANRRFELLEGRLTGSESRVPIAGFKMTPWGATLWPTIHSGPSNLCVRGKLGEVVAAGAS